jgi:probable HAF family extracellular repeat protein
MRDLGMLGGFGSTPFDINNGGEVVGFADPPSNQSRAFRWRNGRMTMLAGLGGHERIALAVNDAGLAVGEARTRHMRPTLRSGRHQAGSSTSAPG